MDADNFVAATEKLRKILCSDEDLHLTIKILEKLIEIGDNVDIPESNNLFDRITYPCIFDKLELVGLIDRKINPVERRRDPYLYFINSQGKDFYKQLTS